MSQHFCWLFSFLESAMAQQQSLADLFDLAPLMFTIEGLKQSFAAKLGVNNLAWAFHNNWKQSLRASKADGTAYPHGNFKLSGVEVGNDVNLKNMSRVGTGRNTTVTQNNASIREFFMFPVRLSFDFEVKFQDVKQGIKFAMAANVLVAISELSFFVNYMGDRWNVRVSIGGASTASIPFPVIEDLNEGSTPGTAAITFQLTVDTKIGFVRDINRINTITINADVASDEDIKNGQRELDEGLSDSFFEDLQAMAIQQAQAAAELRAKRQATMRAARQQAPASGTPESALTFLQGE